MLVKILVFGAAREKVGSGLLEVVLPDGISVAGLVAEVKKVYPVMNELASFSIAVNGDYASKELVLNETDEVAIIPPVSGG